MNALHAASLVALGGASGALARFAGVSGVNRLVELAGVTPGDRFPLGTLLVNVAGCLAVGIIMGVQQSGQRPLEDSVRLLVVIGFLGSLTTFSAFGAETIRLVQDQRAGAAVANIALSMVLGLLAVVVGLGIGRAASA